MQPPLPASEIVIIQQRHREERVWLPVSAGAVQVPRNKTLCKMKQFGIGNGSAAADITACAVKSEPPVWFCDVDGKRVELLTELQTPQKFQKACMNRSTHASADILGDWQAMVTALMSDMSRSRCRRN